MNFKTQKAKIIFTGDWHLGNQDCDLKLIKKHISRISRMGEDTHVYLTGDLIENAINGIGESDQQYSVNYQLEQLKKIIQPIKNRIIGCVLGNHEWRTTKVAKGNLLIRIYESILGCPCYGFEDYFQIKMGKQQYKILVRHPSSRATSTGYIRRLFKACSHNIAGDYDLMVFAHFHQVLPHKRDYYTYNSPELRRKWDCIYGHYLNYKEGYAHEKMLSHHKKGCIIATFERDKHKLEVKEF